MNRFMLAAAAAFLLAAPAAAAPAEHRQFKEKDAISIQPDLAYVLIRSSSKLDLQLVRRPDDQQRVEWAQKRAQAYVKAKKKNDKAWAQYDRDVKTWNSARPEDRNVLPKPEKPMALTEATFAYPPPDLANFVTVFGGRVFSKADGQYSYFIALKPGSYALYRIGLGPCLCMGSVRFDAPAGKVTYAGELNETLTLPTAAVPKPPQLVNLGIEPARFHAAGKMPNFFGTLIDRMPAVPGVLAYKRDVPLDVGSGSAPVDPLN